MEITDKQRLDWFAKNAGCNLISDDNGRWAVSTGGFQPAPPKGGFKEVVGITSVIGPEEWRGSIREAIDYVMQEFDDA